MRVEVKDWFGLLELWFIVDRWRPWYADFNRIFCNSLERGWGIGIHDSKTWEKFCD